MRRVPTFRSTTDRITTVIPQYYNTTIVLRGPGSVIGIATRYGLDGPGIESRCGEIFRTCPDLRP